MMNANVLSALSPLNLIPYPRSITPASGRCALGSETTLRLLAGCGEDDLFTARLLQQSLARHAGLFASLRASAAPPGHENPDILIVEEKLDFSESPEAYSLLIEPTGIRITAPSPAGRFYAAQTLRQLLMQFGAEIPALTITDAPDLPRRGVMLDVSRGKVPKLETLKKLVELFASLKINQLQLYVEHTFAFERHPLPGQGHSPLTSDEILALNAHCRRHHVALVPNLQSFGHVHETLIHERYKHLAESDFRGGWTLSPAVPETYDYLAELYAEFLPLFSHRPFFNVGCDETWDLGQGRSKPLADAQGLGRVYLDHILKIRRLIEPHGCRMAIWGDILEGHPELVPELPRDVVLLNWFYDAHGQEPKYLPRNLAAREAGLEHWVCPGTSGWLSFFFRIDNARDNIAAWAAAARESGATGLLNTDWGDAGHLNPISSSYWSFAWGADRAWRALPDKGAAAEFDRRFLAAVLPGAPAAWLDALNLLGNQYQAFAPSSGLPNMAARALLSGRPVTDVEGTTKLKFFYGRLWPLPSVKEMLEAWEVSLRAMDILEQNRPEDDALRLVQREWWCAAALGACACRRGLAFHGHSGAGSPAARREELRAVLDRMEIAWKLRNEDSDWEATRRELEENQ